MSGEKHIIIFEKHTMRCITFVPYDIFPLLNEHDHEYDTLYVVNIIQNDVMCHYGNPNPLNNLNMKIAFNQWKKSKDYINTCGYIISGFYYNLADILKKYYPEMYQCILNKITDILPKIKFLTSREKIARLTNNKTMRGCN